MLIQLPHIQSFARIVLYIFYPKVLFISTTLNATFEKAKFGVIYKKSLEPFQDFLGLSIFFLIWLTVSGVTPRNEAISFSGTFSFKSGQRCISSM